MGMLDRRPDTDQSVGTVSLCPAMPDPREGERPTAYADRVGEWYVKQTSDRQRKAHGFFLTPVQAADFMGERIAVTGRKVRVLDRADGAGILCCAALEALVSCRPSPDGIKLVAYEVDGDLPTPSAPPVRSGRDRGVQPVRAETPDEQSEGCPAGAVFVNAFPDFGEFRKHMRNIAWEIEVWLCDAADYMVHYDGERFLGSRPAA